MTTEPLIISVEEAILDGFGELRVQGWAAGPTRVNSVEVVVAGVRLGEAEYGAARPDVAADHPEFVGAAQCGFAFAAKLNDFTRQATQAFVIVRAEGLAPQAAARLIASAEDAAAEAPLDDRLRFHCDNFGLYDDGVVEISGWAAHLHEIVRIEVSLDGAVLGDADFGRLRPDVGRAHPEIPSAIRSGFEFAAVLEGAAAGEHEIALAVHTRTGDRFLRYFKTSTQVARDPRHVSERQDIRLQIDSPAFANGAFEDPVRRLLAIEGWAVALHGIAAIEVFLDGVLISEASRGIRRLDIGDLFADWPDALMSGYAVILPRKIFSKESHVVRLAVRDRRGGVKEIELQVAVEPASADVGLAEMRAFVPQAEIDLKMRLIEAAPARPTFAVLIAPGADDEREAARTLDSVAAQAYPHFSIGWLAPEPAQAQAAAQRTGLPVRAFADNTDLAHAVATLTQGDAVQPFFLVLRAGDVLGVDALLEFALEIVTRPEEDFHYSDDRRFDRAEGHEANFLKPEWSPDLLLSTNYIGRAWAAAADVARRAGLTTTAVRDAADYDLALRLTEAAREIGRAPLVLAQMGPWVDDPAQEQAALRAAMARRGLNGGVLETAAPGVYRLRRRLRSKGLVSIVIPTIARGGFIEKCLDSIRKRTAYSRFEIVLIDNIADPDAPEKEWLKRNAECVVEYPGPFNWSKLNNLGAEAALGEYLLFLNDDIETIEPRWLHALMEHAERAEVGVVGPRLLYPDGRIQHAGLYLAETSGRHAFRFADAADSGPFGLAAAQRNVAAVTGACMLMRRDVFNQIGGFDESHPVINNDLDLCLRIWRAGLRVVYTPHATLFHREMASRSAIEDEFDETGFAATWRQTFALGDPFHHPRLAREEHNYTPDNEPTRVIVTGRPLLARDGVRRILVQKLDHVGDFVTGFPALRRLKQRFPQAEIHVLAPTASVALAHLEPAIASVIEFNFFHFVSQQGELEIGEDEWQALEARLKPYRFDIAIDLRKHTDTRDVLKRSGARLLAGYDWRNAFPWLDVALEWDGDERYLPKRAQVADDYVALVEAVSIACERERGTIAPRPADEARRALLALPGLADLRPGLFAKPLVGVHPASGNVLRQWPHGHFARLIDLLVDAFDVHVALIGAASEARVVEATLEETRAVHKVWSLAGRTTLAELPIVLGGLRLFVGNNSGPHHMAAALGTPTIGVHSGVVSAREWGPLGPMAVAVQRDMNCGPCYLEKPTDCPRGLACLQGLRPAEVFRVCEQMLGPALRRDA